MRLFLCFALLLTALSATAQTKGFGVAASNAEKRVALVIGNNSYRNVTPLHNAVNDARSMTKELKSLGFEVLSYENANRKTMKLAVRELEDRVANGGVGFLYYSGHGVAEGGSNYLLPVDIPEVTDSRDLQDEAIELNGVMERLSAAKAKFSLLVIDACRDNPLPRKTGRSIGTSRGLAQPAAPEGMIVVYSAGIGQQALDRLGPGDRDPNGLFTREFIKEIRKPGLEVAELVRNVGKSVKDKAATIKHQQTPAIYIQSVEKYYFTPGSPEKVASASQPSRVNIRSDAEIEQELWDSIRDSQDIDVLGEYLKQYPQGRFASQARVLLVKLRKSERPSAAARETSPPEQAQAQTQTAQTRPGSISLPANAVNFSRSTYPLVGGCMGCHGFGGQSSGAAIPVIAGKSATSIVTALQQFKSGERPSTIMGRLAKGFSEAEMETIGNFFASVKTGGN